MHSVCEGRFVSRSFRLPTTFRPIDVARIGLVIVNNFHAMYKDFPWTTYFPMERVYLTQIGLTDV